MFSTVIGTPSSSTSGSVLLRDEQDPEVTSTPDDHHLAHQPVTILV
jgi:hypothetical protein